MAGVILGSLGVLDDVTVTQVSAVWELRQLQPEATRQEIYKSAVNIGRDHISSTVNTLFLRVATGIVWALVGSIGLVASVPISTWMAARVLSVGSVTRATA